MTLPWSQSWSVAGKDLIQFWDEDQGSSLLWYMESIQFILPITDQYSLSIFFQHIWRQQSARMWRWYVLHDSVRWRCRTIRKYVHKQDSGNYWYVLWWNSVLAETRAAGRLLRWKPVIEMISEMWICRQECPGWRNSVCKGPGRGIAWHVWGSKQTKLAGCHQKGERQRWGKRFLKCRTSRALDWGIQSFLMGSNSHWMVFRGKWCDDLAFYHTWLSPSIHCIEGKHQKAILNRPCCPQGNYSLVRKKEQCQ